MQFGRSVPDRWVSTWPPSLSPCQILQRDRLLIHHSTSCSSLVFSGAFFPSHDFARGYQVHLTSTHESMSIAISRWLVSGRLMAVSREVAGQRNWRLHRYAGRRFPETRDATHPPSFESSRYVPCREGRVPPKSTNMASKIAKAFFRPTELFWKPSAGSQDSQGSAGGFRSRSTSPRAHSALLRPPSLTRRLVVPFTLGR